MDYLLNIVKLLLPYVIWFIVLLLGICLTATKRFRIAGKVLLNLALLPVIWVITFLFLLIINFAGTTNLYNYVVIAYALILSAAISCVIWKIIKKKSIYIPLLAAFAAVTLTWGGYAIYENLDNNIPTIGESERIFADYMPYGEDSKIVVLDEAPSLTLTQELPRLDGATALYPVYAAFAQAVYPKEIFDDSPVFNDYLQCFTTSKAYERLIKGQTDMIFVASASEKQAAYAKEEGVELTFTPIGKEAFVFFVNAKNPVDGLTVEQIQQIYSGEVTDWSAFGSNMGKIRAFQRDEGSGSQTALQKLMQGKTLMAPPKEDVVTGMGGIIEQTADYKNYKNAIGYSFRFYSTEMVQNNQIKLLKLDGVAPTKENIINGTYPIASEFYAVTTQYSNPNCQPLLEWICGEQGQRIVDETGYVAVN